MVLQLQRTVGNQATLALLRPTPVQAATPVVQRGGKKKRRKKGRRGRRGGHSTATTTTTQAPTTTATAAPTSLLGKAWSYLNPFGGEQAEEEEEEGLGTTSVSTGDEGDSMSRLGREEESQLSGEAEAEEEEAEEGSKLFEIPKVVINLGSRELMEGALGKLKAEGKATGGLDEFQIDGKIEYEYAKEGKRPVTQAPFQVWGPNLTAAGTLSGFLGVKAAAEVEAQRTSKLWAAKGKLGAFAGMEHKGEAEVVLKVGETELAKFKGALGWTVGVGGELSASISWPSGGSWKVSSKGKLSAGIGSSWEYELELPVSSFAPTLWSWVKSWGASWATWLYDGFMAHGG